MHAQKNKKSKNRNKSKNHIQSKIKKSLITHTRTKNQKITHAQCDFWVFFTHAQKIQKSHAIKN